QRTPPREQREQRTPDGAAVSGTAPARSEAKPEVTDRGAEAKAPVKVERADTIALVDQVDKPREVPTKIAIAIIVTLSVLAGIGPYIVRATSAPQDAAPGSSASIPSVNAPSSRGQGIR